MTDDTQDRDTNKPVRLQFREGPANKIHLKRCICFYRWGVFKDWSERVDITFTGIFNKILLFSTQSFPPPSISLKDLPLLVLDTLPWKERVKNHFLKSHSLKCLLISVFTLVWQDLSKWHTVDILMCLCCSHSWLDAYFVIWSLYLMGPCWTWMSD